MSCILAIDQGTTSSRAIVFDEALAIVATAQEEFHQSFPRSGWVEHDPDDIWTSVAATCRGAIERAGISAADIAAIGITNQRETTLVWERATGRPLGPAIVWQDRRTAALCAELRAAGHEPMITERTGLILDPYFSGTKLKWLLDAHDGARARARRGELLFGTVDTWLIWKLTGGRAHVTDATNASRTLLYNIRDNAWDPEILRPPRHTARDAARKSATAPTTSAPPAATCSAARSPSPASPATSRPRPSARPASSREC